MLGNFMRLHPVFCSICLISGSIVWPLVPLLCSALLNWLIFEWIQNVFPFPTNLSSFHVGTVFENGKTSDYLLLGNFVYTVSGGHLPRLHMKLNYFIELILFSNLNVCISVFKGCSHIPLKMRRDVLTVKRLFYVRL